VQLLPHIASHSTFIVDAPPSFNISLKTKKVSHKTKQRLDSESESEVEFVEPPDVFSVSCPRLREYHLFVGAHCFTAEIVSPSKHHRALVVTSPPESDEEQDTDEAPVSPRSRFLNRKRVDSEAESDRPQVHSPRKKLRPKPRVSSLANSDSEQGLFASRSKQFVILLELIDFHADVVMSPLSSWRKDSGSRSHPERLSTPTKARRRHTNDRGESLFYLRGVVMF
jgi:hypothetical protein